MRVIYIMGVGRSGSTIIDTILGNHPNIESVGELTNLVSSGWINDEYCACGVPAKSCPYWSVVRQEWMQSTAIDDLVDYLSLQRKYKQYRHLWPRLTNERRHQSPNFKLFGELTYQLFESIKTVSHKPIIVDSSKHPVRAFALSMMPGIDLRLIHLVRDIRGVAWSLSKPYKRNEKEGIQKNIKSRPVARTAVLWTLANLQAEWVRSQLNPGYSIQIRYEDLVANPLQTLEKIGQLVECDLSDVANAVVYGRSLEVGHTIAGNRLRMAGKVHLRADTEWMEKMPKKDKEIVWTIAGWLMRRYSYKK